MRRGFLAAAFALCLALISASPAAAAPLPLPDPVQPRHYDPYPPQMPAAGVSGQYAAPGGGFLTLPYIGDHFISSNFDHCNPTYAVDGVICRFDGTRAYAANDRDPDATTGYAMTAGGKNWLYYDGHDGWDVGLYYEPVLAAADGLVTFSGWANAACHACSSGETVRIDHRNGFDTYYGHLSQLLVGVGQWVRRGEVIAISGASGSATGAHLHFGVYKHATFDPVDPYGWEGAGADPWPDDVGNLWVNGAARSPAVPVPALNVTAAQVGDTNDVAVAWSTPGDGDRFDVTMYRDGDIGQPVAVGTAATSFTFHGDAGHTYWFDVFVRSDLGLTDSAASPLVTLFPQNVVGR